MRQKKTYIKSMRTLMALVLMCLLVIQSTGTLYIYTEDVPEKNINTSVVETTLDMNKSGEILNNNQIDSTQQSTQNQVSELKEKQGVIEKIAEDTTQFMTDRYIVKYKKNEGEKSLKAALGNLVKHSKQLRKQDYELVILNEKVKPRDLVKDIKDNKVLANVEYIQPDYQLALAMEDPYSSSQWALNGNDLNDEQFSTGANILPAWEESTGEGVVVAVLDTAIDIYHEDLAENIWSNTGEVAGDGVDNDLNGFVDDINGWDFTNDINQIYSPELVRQEWHGTMVAGIIAAVKDNKKGISGVAPNAKIMPLKVFHNGMANTSDIIDAIQYAERMKVKVVNCSWGSPNYNPALEEAISQSNMLFLVAAGNSYMNIDESPIYPASLNSENIITIASLNQSGILSNFSNYGVVSVDIAAPGESIYGILPDNNYGQGSGTSFATPFVAGEAALLLSTNKDIDIGLLKETIINSSDKLSSLVGKITNGNKINVGNAILGITNSEEIILDNSGNNSDPVSSSDNNYDLYTTGTWANLPNLPYAAEGIGLAEVNGKLYAVGGAQETGFAMTYMNSLHEYDPVTQSWKPRASMPTARAFTGIAVASGKIYVIGGYNGSYLSKVEEYDPTADRWTSKTNMPTVRGYLGAAEVGGKIYAIGGQNGSFMTNYLSKVEEYNPMTNTWIAKADMMTARAELGLTAANGSIYAIGGYNGSCLANMEKYNPVNNTWTTVASLVQKIRGAGATTVDGKVYLVGGSYEIEGGIEEYSLQAYTIEPPMSPIEIRYSTSLSEYNPSTNSWTYVTNMNTGKTNIGVAGSKSIYVACGYDGITYLDTVESYTIATAQDSTAPIISVTPTTYSSIENYIAVTVDVTDNDTVVNKYYKWSTSTVVPTTWDILSGTNIVQTVNGNWYLHLKAVDSSGNTKITYYGPYTLQKPSVTITASPASSDWYTIADLEVSITCDPSRTIIEKAYLWSTSADIPSSWIDGTSNPNTMLFRQLNAGIWYLHIKVVDNTNQLTIKTFGPYKIDRTMPSIAVDIPTLEWQKADVSIQPSFADAESGISTMQYKWSDSTTVPSTWDNYTSGGIIQSNEGVWYLHIKASDKAGNQNTKYFGPYMLDKTAPSINALIQNNTLTLNITDSNSGVSNSYYQLSTTEETPIAWNVYNGESITVLDDNRKYLHMKAQDKAGNIITQCERIDVIFYIVYDTTVATDSIYNYILSASDISSIEDKSFIVEYDVSMFELYDLHVPTVTRDIEIGNVLDSDIYIIENDVSAGRIVFKMNYGIPDGYSWSGIINIIGFKAKQTGQANIIYKIKLN